MATSARSSGLTLRHRSRNAMPRAYTLAASASPSQTSIPFRLTLRSKRKGAERVGFEPTIRFNTRYAISSRAPSTTRTPLQPRPLYFRGGGQDFGADLGEGAVL